MALTTDSDGIDRRDSGRIVGNPEVTVFDSSEYWARPTASRLPNNQPGSDLRPLSESYRFSTLLAHKPKQIRDPTCEKRNEFGSIVSGRPYFLVVDNWELRFARPASPFMDRKSQAQFRR